MKNISMGIVKNSSRIIFLGNFLVTLTDIKNLIFMSSYILSFFNDFPIKQIFFHNGEENKIYIIPSQTVRDLVNPLSSYLKTLRKIVNQYNCIRIFFKDFIKYIIGENDSLPKINMEKNGITKFHFFKKNDKIFRLINKKIEDVNKEKYFIERSISWHKDYMSLFRKYTLSNFFHRGEIIKSYDVDIFSINIIEPHGKGFREYFYNVRLKNDSVFLRAMSSYLALYVRKHTPHVFFFKSLDELIKIRIFLLKSIALKKIPEIEIISSQVPKNIMVKVASYKSVRILRLMPFLLDNYIEEFYVDHPGIHVYLDHSLYGRCVSNIRIFKKDINSFITHLKIDTGARLDFERPSLKTDYINNLFKIRVSIDAPPLTVDGPSLDIRKYRKRGFNIVQLIRLGTLSIEAAAFLILAISSKLNISIIGEPGSGKTTLLNSLDLCLPKFFRVIYIEDVVESILVRGRHQLRLTVETYEEGEEIRRKSIEVIKLLHRRPDYIILGELQSQDHFLAAFHAMSAGLKCIQTSHASSVNGFLNRMLHVINISSDLIGELDLIVLMKKFLRKREIRKVYSITELIKDPGIKKIIVSEIFSYKHNKLILIKDLRETSCFRKISKEFEISIADVYNLWIRLVNTLRMLLNKDVENSFLINKAIEIELSKLWG